MPSPTAMLHSPLAQDISIGHLIHRIQWAPSPGLQKDRKVCSNETGNTQQSLIQPAHSKKDSYKVPELTPDVILKKQLYQHRPQIAKNNFCVIKGTTSIPQSWSSPPPPTIAHYNGTLQWHHVHSAKVGRHPPPNHSTPQWHPAMAPRPLPQPPQP